MEGLPHLKENRINLKNKSTTFRGFGTERARLGTFRGFGTELDDPTPRAADIAGIPKKATQDSIGITENTLGILEGFQKK